MGQSLACLQEPSLGCWHAGLCHSWEPRPNCFLFAHPQKACHVVKLQEA